jgi:DNA-binding XRE family transcriptional regulator
MARKTWKEARRRFSAEGEARIEREKNEILLEGNLREIREHLSDLNQTDMGKLLEVSQEAVSQLERRHDAAVSSIARFIASLGGRLELHAVFPNESIRITQFEDIRGQVMGGRRKR